MYFGTLHVEVYGLVYVYVVYSTCLNVLKCSMYFGTLHMEVPGLIYAYVVIKLISLINL